MTFEEFAAGHLQPVLGFAAVLAGDRASAEDIVQEVLIRAHQHWDRIGSLDRPEFYIRKMVVNEFLSSRRRLWRLLPSGRGSELGDRPVPDPADRYVEHDALLAELRKLPRRQRAVLVLRYYEGLPDAEIAELLGCAPSTVRKCASRAFATLRIELSSGSAEGTVTRSGGGTCKQKSTR
jgi:RNA polymerase sigma-70 factor (sigma-E family)